MTIDAYINPDFTVKEKLIFWGASLLLTLICAFLVAGVAVILSGFKKRSPQEEGERKGCEAVFARIQLFFEMIISGSTAMFFSCSYIIMNHLYSLLSDMPGEALEGGYAVFYSIWTDYKDFVLLLFICLSCVLNSILDRLIIPLKFIDKGEKASVRLLAMFYAIAILVILNRIGDESEYSPVMMYYLGLMVGRFIYFDASFRDFLETMGRALSNFFMLVLGLCLTGALCYYGFGNGFFLEKNYYIVGVFYVHLFLLVSVFLLHHSRLFRLLLKNRKSEDIEEE